MANKIVFDIGTMQIMSLFDKITRAALKDCISEADQITFIVESGEMSKAIGKAGANVKLLEKKLKKKVKIVGFADDACQFAANLMYPAKVKDCSLEGGIITIQSENHSSRGLMIGRNAANLRRVEGIVKRYFDVTEIKVK